jgi:predicted PurR-regulated permease PerM
MTNPRLELIAFFVLLGVLGLVVGFMWFPFLKLLAVAGIIAILFLPIHRRVTKSTGNEILATWLTILLILFIVMVPLYLIGQLLFNELLGLYGNIRNSGITVDKSEIIQRLPPQFQAIIQNLSQDLGQRLSGFAANTFQGVTNILSNVAGFFLAFFLVFFTLYYLLRDGDKIKKVINSILPLSEAHENLLVKRLELAVNGVVKGMFLVALAQGVVATIGFVIFKVPNPFLWGAFTVLAALVPTVGTAIAIVPAILFLFVTGNTGAGIGLAVWGTLAVGLIDNIISPKLVGARVKLHPLLVLFSVLGGIQLFGFIGFLLGPLVMAMFVALLDIYRTDLKTHLDK